MLIRSFAVALFVLLGVSLPAQAEVRIALLPISVHATGGDSDYLQSGLSEMIAARLDQYEGVTVVRPRVDGTPPTAAPTARDIAESVDADLVLYGSFTRFGDGASLDLRCARVDVDPEGGAGSERRLFIQSGELAEIIPQLDTLAQKVARYALQAGAPRVAGADDGKAAAHGAGPSAAEHEALLKRVEELERAMLPALAESAEEDEVLVR